jgi:hypothetical protein
LKGRGDSGKKSKSKEKDSNISPICLGKIDKNSKSPVTKTIIRKRVAVTPQKPKRVKRQKVTDSKVQIKVLNTHEEIKEHNRNSNFNKKGTNEENKFENVVMLEVGKTTTPKKSSTKSSPLKTKSSPLVIKNSPKEESKERKHHNHDSKIISPFEIKKMIENSLLSRERILNSIYFPDPKNGSKILQSVKEISISSVKKIQSSIQRIKATEKKLTELRQKTKESLRRKGISLNSKHNFRSKHGKFFHSDAYILHFKIFPNLNSQQLVI